MFKVIVAGGRYFNDYQLLKSKLDIILSNINDDIEIVSGCANGADSLGERYAIENNYSIRKFPAPWKTEGNTAGPIRNRQMAEYADACVIFWNGNSKGSKNMIHEAEKRNLKLRIIRY